ncbi:MAG: CocE/NonD family hydrolase [Planctomycetia bacterium]|nr:CocE/NonD family hydrolase [Planctomycetia bacterium]
MKQLFLPLLCLATLCRPTVALAQGLEYVKANYTKYEFRIPMRDGKRLFTAVYVPKDDLKKYPLLMTRTPYTVRPYGVDQYKADLGPSPLFGKAGYIFVYQDVRGRWMSEGEFVNMRPHNPAKKGPAEIDESTDTHDTIDWLLKHVPNHNGKVGLYGISYPGFYTSAGMIDAHPALKAASPQAPIADWFIGDDWHHNGAFMLPHAFNFMANFGKPRPEPIQKSPYLTFDHGTPDGYDFFLKMGPIANADTKYFKGEVAFWNEVMKHGSYDDFWKTRNLRPHLKNIRPAVMTVGGWFDAENLFGALETYQSVEAQSPGITNVLVMGPWLHGGWQGGRGPGDKLGDIPFNAKTADYYREKIELPFFEYYLKGKGLLPHPEAWVFETGTNQWKTYDAWPPKTAQRKTFYLRAGGKLTSEPPTDSAAHDDYLSDPAKPVPFIDKIGVGMLAEYMVSDQRFASRRPDVLVYETEPLAEDLNLAGPIQVELHVATTGTDADWVVKVIDVYPPDYPDPNPNPTGVKMGGYQQLVRGDVLRGKFRNSFEKPEAFKPGQPTVVKFTLPDVCHAFRSGHRLMVQVQSSWFPLIDRNPQSFVDIYTAKESDFQRATQQVFRSRDQSSRITVRVLP